MPRYTITIADVDLFIQTEESAQTVHLLVDTVDARIREIASKNLRLSKSEASILCAVDYCADKLKCQDKNNTLERELAELSEELEAVKKDLANLTAESDELRRENRILNGIITKNMAAAAQLNAERDKVSAGVQLSIETPVASAEVTPAAEVMFEGEAAEDTPVDADKKDRRARKSGKDAPKNNKVGDMFDLLTFKRV